MLINKLLINEEETGDEELVMVQVKTIYGFHMLVSD